MKRYIAAIMYTAIALGATPSFADSSAAAALRTGDMKKLVFHSTPEATSSAAFFLPDAGGEKTLDDYSGKYVLVNFWATWCAPCRKEMPMLSELQTEFSGDNFEVVTIATGRNTPAGISKFFADSGIKTFHGIRTPSKHLPAKWVFLDCLSR